MPALRPGVGAALRIQGDDQVLRALLGMLRDGRHVRLGYGLYARAIVSRRSGEPILYRANGLLSAARQALDKLGVAWEPAQDERAYNVDRSTQAPGTALSGDVSEARPRHGGRVFGARGRTRTDTPCGTGF